MKKLIKTILFTIIVFAVIVVTNSQVQADSFNLTVSADKQYVAQGETVTINLRLNNIDAGELGINTLEAKLQYDTSIFEEVRQSNIKSVNNWSITYNDEDTEENGKLLAVIVQSGVKEDQDIGSITLKVKENVEYKKTTITISNIESNNGQTTIAEEDKQVVLEVGNKNGNNSGNNNEAENGNNQASNNSQNAGGNGNNNGNGGGSGNGNGNSKSNIIIQGENMSSGKLPQTGVTNGVIIGVGIALIVLAIILYIRYQNIGKQK